MAVLALGKVDTAGDAVCHGCMPPGKLTMTWCDILALYREGHNAKAYVHPPTSHHAQYMAGVEHKLGTSADINIIM
jgi:hypothetical protein